MASSTARISLEDLAKSGGPDQPGLAPAQAAAADGAVPAMWGRLLAAFPRGHIAADEAEPQAAKPGTVMSAAAFLPRCILLQSIAAAVLVGLWLAGILQKPFEGDSGFLCWFIVAIGALGIACVFAQRWRDVQWIATHVVRIGLLGTVVGLIMAFSAAAAGDSSDPSAIKPMIAAVVSGMYVSLFATLLGIVTNLWLKINLRVLGHDHG
jgi:predicted secreted protein